MAWGVLSRVSECEGYLTLVGRRNLRLLSSDVNVRGRIIEIRGGI